MKTMILANSKASRGAFTVGFFAAFGLAVFSWVALAHGQTTGEAVLAGTINLGNNAGCPGLRLGDLNGDGKYEIVMAQPIPQPDAHTPQEVARVTAYTLTGTILWQYTRPGNPTLTNHTASSDIPVQVYDWDGDGSSEVIAAFGKTELTFLDGKTGKVVRTLPIPQGTSANGASGSNDCILIAKLRPTARPQDFIVKTRYTQAWGINGETGAVLWTYKKHASNDDLAHFGYIINADADSLDEYLAGWHLLDHDGKLKWSGKNMTMHIDAFSVGDVDNNPTNGLEIAFGSQVGILYRANTGEELWRDNSITTSGQGIQHIAIGDYNPNNAGKEVIMLERIGPRDATGRDANILVSSTGKLLWKESRTGSDYGWVTVTERITNWDGTGKDQILSYRRTSKPATIYDGDGKTVVAFPYQGSDQEFAAHADLCGDAKEEVITYNANTLRIFANGGCDLAAPSRVAALPQNRRHYNWSIYSGWDAVDYTFYTPGATRIMKEAKSFAGFSIQPTPGMVKFQGIARGAIIKIRSPLGQLVAVSGPVQNGAWTWETGKRKGVFFMEAQGQTRLTRTLVLP